MKCSPAELRVGVGGVTKGWGEDWSGRSYEGVGWGLEWEELRRGGVRVGVGGVTKGWGEGWSGRSYEGVG